MARYTKVASGNIVPSSFVILDTSNYGQVSQAAGTTVALWGIVFPGMRNAPWAPLQDGYAAVLGENVGIYGPGENEVLLRLGGTVTIGAYLTSDGSGYGVATTTTGAWVGAEALQAGVSGDFITVRVFTSTEF